MLQFPSPRTRIGFHCCRAALLLSVFATAASLEQTNEPGRALPSAIVKTYTTVQDLGDEREAHLETKLKGDR